MFEYFAYHGHLGDERYHLAQAATGAGEDVDGEDPAQQRGPIQAGLSLCSRRRGGWNCGSGGRWGRGRYDVRAQLGAWGEHALEVHQMNSRRGHQRGEPAGQLEGGEDEVRRAIGECSLHPVLEAAIFPACETGQAQGASGAVAADELEALPVVLVDVGVGVKREAFEERTATVAGIARR